MSLPLRILLIAGALLALAFVASRIKKRKILMEDAISWVIIAIVLIVVAAFPQICFFFADVLGFMSPSNFVFLVIIGLLLAKVFSCTAEISLLKYRVNELAQEVGLQDQKNASKRGE